MTVKICNYAVCYLVLLSICYKFMPNFACWAASFVSVSITEHLSRNPDRSRNQDNCGFTIALAHFRDVCFESSNRCSYALHKIFFFHTNLTFGNMQQRRNYLINDLSIEKGYKNN